MPILKQQASQPLIRDAVVLDLGDLGKQAAKLKAAAQARAEQILQDARDEAQRIIAAAEQTGFDAGHAKGLAQGMEEGKAQGHAEALAAGNERVQHVTAQFDAVAKDWDAYRTEMDREARSAVLRFALKFAQQVTHRVIEVDPGVIADQVATALSHVLEPTDVAIRVHPEDQAALREVLPDLLAGLSHLQHVDLIEDESVGRGGCKLGLNGGEVDASIPTQIRRLTEVILPGASAEDSAPSEADSTPSPTETTDTPPTDPEL
ncbi:FliH/SctL family protein [Algisphaera agarilytica]|uniref:Flagellar assembly protein FliH n=1 Tax=Algisphaera agarilytica TaxID=1385975 RepID=A0A7X0H7W3_9BACT|nr:FliH/SctL family protein [Algisphaera agarilytica]MBB6430738.1 flagellar assembly protein FliH [Algisphaera agarilytica]